MIWGANMKLEELKTGFWGYKKFSVYQYITALEEQFSAKLLEKDEEHRQLLEQERQRVLQLEEELSTLRQQYEAQKNDQLMIANTLMEAQRYAELLKAQTDEQAQIAKQQLAEAVAQRDQDLQRYDARLQQLRDLFQSMLQEMDASSAQLVLELEHVKSEVPDQNMSLFHRKPELVV